jgi:SAM-dependent methyltransferase
MNKNLKIVAASAGNSFFNRHLYFYNNSVKNPNKKKGGGVGYGASADDHRMLDLIKANNLKADSILEIGCSTGIKLNEYRQILSSKVNYGIDLSSKAIISGRAKYKKIKLLKLSSLEIYKIKPQFDLIICGFFLYLLDREEIFNQFNLIYKKLRPNGYLIIEDYDPLFKHTNTSIHNKNLKSFKTSYNNFLEESGLFKSIYKIRSNANSSPLRKHDKRFFKSEDIALSLYKKINFINSYPENI